MSDLLTAAHPLVAWLVTIAGGVCVGLLLVAARRRDIDPRALGALRVFAALVVLQVLLGLATAATVERGTAFDGDQDKALWHAVLGGVAALTVILALWSSRDQRRTVLTLLLTTTALVAPNLGRLGVILLTVLVGVGIGVATSGRQRPATAVRP